MAFGLVDRFTGHSEPSAASFSATSQGEPVAMMVESVAAVAKEDVAKISISIEGMTCSACSSTITSALLGMDGVVDCQISVVANRGDVTFHSSLVTPERIVEEIEDVGFGASVRDTNSCGGLARYVVLDGLSDSQQKQLLNILKTDGIVGVSYDFSAAMIHVQFDQQVIGVRRIYKAIQAWLPNIHMELIDHERDLKAKRTEMDDMFEAESSRSRRRFHVSLIFIGPVIFLTMFLDMIPAWDSALKFNYVHNHCSWHTLLLAGFVSPIQFYVGADFYRGAFKSLRNMTANMDVLVALGTSMAYFYSLNSVVMMFCTPHYRGVVFFETSAFLITTILLGKYLELVAKRRTSTALTELMGLQPSKARVVTLEDLGHVDNAEQIHHDLRIIDHEDIDVKMLEVGDAIFVARGDRIPVDGVVIRGRSHVNEALITGEAAAVEKSVGMNVVGATVNLEAPLVIKATGVGAETLLSGIVRLVEEAQTKQAPIQYYADTIAGRFVPFVLSLALTTFVVWFTLDLSGLIPVEWKPEGHDSFLFAFMFAVSVVVVSCPCALGLATPTAVMVATGVGARNGILYKTGGIALERAGKVRTVLFDKTGTLTIGAPIVQVVIYASDDKAKAGDSPSRLSKIDLWMMIGAAEMESEHTLGLAIYAHSLNWVRQNSDASAKFEEPESFNAVTGAGVSAVLRTKEHVLIGTMEFLADEGVVLNESARNDSGINWIDRVQQVSLQGASPILVAVDGSVEALLGLADAPRQEALAVVDTLRNQGIEVRMVTGDHRNTALAIARLVGIPEDMVHAQVRPGDKAKLVEDLQAFSSSGDELVMFVGDGINDSPALAQAHVGVAVGAGAAVAVATADVVLVRSNLADVVVAMDLSEKTLRRIHMNFMWAIVYNLLAIPYAAGVFFWLTHPFMLPPELAGASMALSSISVVLSSLGLRWYKKPIVSKHNPPAFAQSSSFVRGLHHIDIELEPVDGERKPGRGRRKWFRSRSPKYDLLSSSRLNAFDEFDFDLLSEDDIPLI